ncbi:MAG: enoyl-CoA hydratase-related protein, partial [Actinomycetes bacterium]
MTHELITAQYDGQIVELTMRNTARANAISAQFAQELVAQLQRAVGAGARVLILRAEPGVRTWCAGHDIQELPSDPSDQISWTNSLETLVSGVRSVPIPIIAAVEGGVWGGGCELVMTADLVIACRNSTFAVTPTRLGVPYAATGLNRFLAALPIHVVNEMFLTANPIDAQRAYE